MITIPLFEAMVAVGGRSNIPVSPFHYVTKITQNSKAVTADTLFVALRGNRVDGHDFIAEAQAAGAIAAVVEYEVAGIDIPQFIVPSSEDALGELAKTWRGRVNIPLVAVTGSVGKTSTKEMIAHILAKKYHTHKSRKNFNNQLGVPIELSRLQQTHQCSVVEFGMRGLNQINYLSRITRPTIGVITNIGMSHIEMLGTRENIAKAKAEIFTGMDTGSITVLNSDDDYFEFFKAQAPGKVIAFGTTERAEVRVENIQLNEKGNPSFSINGIAITMRKSIGKHHAFNAAAAFAVAQAIGVEREMIADRIASFETPEHRGQFSNAHCGALLLDNTYNAAPDSIKASLYNLAEIGKQGRRTVAVIGEMLELGEYSVEAHAHIGELVGTLAIDLLVTVGAFTKHMGEAAKRDHWKHFDSIPAAAAFLLSEVSRKDVVLLQGSRKLSLEMVVEALEKGQLPA